MNNIDNEQRNKDYGSHTCDPLLETTTILFSRMQHNKHKDPQAKIHQIFHECRMTNMLQRIL